VNLLDLPRLEHGPGDLEPTGEDDLFACELAAVEGELRFSDSGAP
jgi:hypothetical protein